jgi:uncharacterized lipoprotein YajG
MGYLMGGSGIKGEINANNPLKNKKMKKVFSLALVAGMFVFASCESKTETTETTTTETVEATDAAVTTDTTAITTTDTTAITTTGTTAQ